MGDDVGGIAVHIGARIAAEADVGEVLASSTVKDLVVGSGLSFHDRGSRPLKGRRWNVAAVRRRVRIMAIAIGVGLKIRITITERPLGAAAPGRRRGAAGRRRRRL